MDDRNTDYQKAYDDWSATRTPQSTGKLLSTLDPVIQRGISNYAGGKNDPLMTSRARRLALNAVHSYDPKQDTKLTTHVNNHLQGLRRVARQQQQVLKMPDRVSMEQAYLHNAQAELEDNLGREPSTSELADYSRFSPTKIARIRRYMPGVAEGTMTELAGDVQFGGQAQTDRTHRLATALHDDLAPADQKILEWSLGLFGHKPISNTEVAARLRVTPGAVSQRKAKIQAKLDQLMSL